MSPANHHASPNTTSLHAQTSPDIWVGSTARNWVAWVPRSCPARKQRAREWAGEGTRARRLRPPRVRLPALKQGTDCASVHTSGGLLHATLTGSTARCERHAAWEEGAPCAPPPCTMAQRESASVRYSNHTSCLLIHQPGHVLLPPYCTETDPGLCSARPVPNLHSGVVT